MKNIWLFYVHSAYKYTVCVCVTNYNDLHLRVCNLRMARMYMCDKTCSLAVSIRRVKKIIWYVNIENYEAYYYIDYIIVNINTRFI
jgi:hypothetical protein